MRRQRTGSEPPDATPYSDGSSDELLTRVPATSWPYDRVTAALPTMLGGQT
ncbi:hypothetical protein [Pseudonocardia sp.]|uniref:hypothetical protein n=1 Tax=Pseudonocardia sp. TaxID=60912 RepID=UPI0026390FAC|nr:hypothetical protein [Pseudonocardia sp.]